MRLQKRLAAMLIVTLLFCAVSVPAYADEVLDNSKKGSISVTMTYENKPVSGGTMTLYRVGAVKEDDGNYGFELTGHFTGSGADLTDISSADLAKELAQYIKDQSLTGMDRKIGKDGEVTFSNLELGLYLLVQNKSANGYNKTAPFLVSVPIRENGIYLYNVNASPKVELEKGPAPTPTTPTKIVGSALPQTGQLNWPIPILAVLGLGLFSLGWMLRIGSRKGGYEK